MSGLWHVYRSGGTPACIWNIIVICSDTEGSPVDWFPQAWYSVDPTYIYLMSYLDPIVHSGGYVIKYSGDGSHWKLSDYTPQASWYSHTFASFLGLNANIVADNLYIGTFNLLDAIIASPAVITHLVNAPVRMPTDLGGGYFGAHGVLTPHYYFDPFDTSVIGRRTTVFGKCI